MVWFLIGCNGCDHVNAGQCSILHSDNIKFFRIKLSTLISFLEGVENNVKVIKILLERTVTHVNNT